MITGSAAVMPTGDACYEAWVNLDKSKSSPAILAATTTGGTYNAVITVRDDQGLIHFGVSNGGPGLTTSYAVDPHDATWHHVAGCRKITGASVTLTLFWDGQLVDTVAGSTSQIGPASDLRLGSLSYATTDGLGGYIDEVRVSSTIRYTGSFTPAPRLQNDGATALLLHFDSLAGGTFADDSSNALTGTTLGSAAPASVCPVCGDSCGACSSLSIPVGGGAVVNGSAAVMPTGDACYEAWVNLDKSKSSPAILAATTAGDTYDAVIGVRDDQGLIHFAVQNGGPLLATSHAVDPHDATWHHVAGCRKVTGASVTLTLFWDGKLVDTVAGTTSQIGPASDLRLGSLSYATTDGLGGYIDEVRVSSTIRYTGSFAPAPQCFAPDATTAVLLRFDPSSGVFSDASANALTVSPLGTAAQAPVCP